MVPPTSPWIGLRLVRFEPGWRQGVIEYKFGKVKRYRKETFCYGPRSCPLYDMGPPRQVPYFDSFPPIDEGWMDDLCTEQREDED